ncbi:organic cation transporter protein-like [Ruditapes philippinarum]|uniref:organic cation transporter protein-like n=1 Tax=Ruditapes philippinarum TaxID=129788 RepID=UPI00295C0AE3|nr:organic cation transporter protein-like [Ruditapes philippinarum]
MSSYSSRLDSLIEDIGGCGTLQKLLCVLIHITVILAAWSLLGMAFIGYDPGFTCRKLDVNANKLSSINMSEISTNRLCSFGNYSTCSSYLFPTGIKTVISEMVGVLVGNIISGPLADSLGRKPSIISSVLLLVIFNFGGYFSQSWKSYSVIRFFIGIGAGIYFNVDLPILAEFVPSKLRTIALAFPSEPLSAMLFAFITYWLHDWRSVHLLKTIIGIPLLMNLCFIPESFRWLVSKMKFERAEQSIGFVANVNGVIKPDPQGLFEAAKKEIAATSDENISPFSFTILWSNKDLRIITLSLAVPWQVP